MKRQSLFAALAAAIRVRRKLFPACALESGEGFEDWNGSGCRRLAYRHRGRSGSCGTWRAVAAQKLVFQLADLFFHLLAGLKGYDKFPGNIHSLTGAWVAGLASGSFLDFEYTKVSQLDPVILVFDQRIDDGVERLLTISFVFSCVIPISSEIVLTISFLVTLGSPPAWWRLTPSVALLAKARERPKCRCHKH